jgi:hypothetical protein
MSLTEAQQQKHRRWKLRKSNDPYLSSMSSVLECTPESHKLLTAPIFYPTSKEFQDPIAYIEKIRHIAEPYGICKIVPPKEYDLTKQVKSLSDLNINSKTFTFKTKIQKISDLQFRAGNPKANLNSPVKTPEKRIHQNGSSPISSVSTSTNGNHSSTIESLKRKMDSSLNGNTSKSKRRKVASYKVQQYDEQQDDYNDANGDEGSDDSANFGFERTKDKISLKQFKSQANRFKKTFLRKQIEKANTEDSKYLAPGTGTTIRNRELPQPVLRKLARRGGIQRVQSVTYYDSLDDVSDADIESEYWRIVERVDPTMDSISVQYGSDLINMPVSENSCFPKNWKCDWAGNKLPTVDNSLLKYLYMNIPGITSPMLYVGMLFSSFCWHVEDHYLYAINYLHHGAHKTWYGIPGSAAEKFEQFTRSRFPGLFEANPKLLECLVTMVNPRLLIENGVPVYRMNHEPGTFMITFPRAYHSGFNHGFNFAESTNFAPGSWIPWGRLCSEKYYLKQRPSTFSQDQVCLTALHHLEEFDDNVCDLIRKEVIDIIQRENTLRASLRQEKEITKVVEMPNTKKNPHLSRKASVQKDNKVCHHCRQDCYLSAVLCSTCYDSTKRTIQRGGDIDDPNHYMCLRCVLSNDINEMNICDHKKEKFCLLIRYTDDKLQEFINTATKKNN